MITKIDSQGTLVRVDTKLIGCLQSIGNLEETRSVTSYTCMSSNESTKALGGVERGSLDLGCFLDPDDAEGQEALKTAFDTNAEVAIEIELSNGVTSGTIYGFTGQVSSYSVGIEKDAIVSVDFTVEITSVIAETPAVLV